LLRHGVGSHSTSRDESRMASSVFRVRPGARGGSGRLARVRRPSSGRRSAPCCAPRRSSWPLRETGARPDRDPNDLWVPTTPWLPRSSNPTGDHRREGVIAAAGAGVPQVDLGVRELADIAPTALAWCDTAPPGDLDGSVIEAPAAGRPSRPREPGGRTVPVRDRGTPTSATRRPS
jgi:hypothetical protein